MTFERWVNKYMESYEFSWPPASERLMKAAWNAAIREAIKCLEEDEWTRESEFALRAMKELMA